jgi:putative SOS response-associated peptidase YedK
MEIRSRSLQPMHLFPVGRDLSASAAVLVCRTMDAQQKLDVTSCTIITMPSGEPMAKLHDRQPVILAESDYDAWLDPETAPAARRR